MASVIGRVTRSGMLEMKRRGLSPEDAVQAVLSEAKRRYPEASVIFQGDVEGGMTLLAI